MANKKDNLLEIKDGVNLDKIKKELNEYVHKQVDFEVKEVLEKNQKVLLRNKTFVIVRRDIIILLLIFLSLYLGYQLYHTGYFNKYYKEEYREPVDNNNIPSEVEPKDEEEKESEVVKPTLDELKEKYSELLNSYHITSSSKYYDDFYGGNYSNNMRLFFALVNVDSKYIEVDDDSTFVDESHIKDKYKELFMDDYEGASFDYVGTSFKYSEGRSVYFANQKVNNSYTSDIVREIIEIKEDDEVSIITVEGLKKDNKVLNPVSKKEIDGSDLVKNKDKLIKIKYSFVKDSDTYKLKKIEVVN